MINTASKRSIANRFGMNWLAGTRTPNNSINKYDRAALLGCYVPDSTRVVTLSYNLSINRSIEMELIR